MKHIRTILEVLIIIGVLFYFFGLEPTKQKYYEVKHKVESYFPNTTNNRDTTIINDTVFTQQIIFKDKHEYTDSIPFEYKNKRILITLYVEDIPIKGILDTGADSGLFLSVTEYEFFKRNGINVGQITQGTAIGISGEPVTAYNGYLNNIRIGTRNIDKIDVSYSEVCGDSENLFGINIFNEKFTVDYNNNKIYFYK